MTNNRRDTPQGAQGDGGGSYSRKDWRNFANTLTAIVDLAVERDRQEGERAGGAADEAAQRFEFLPMAAADRAEPPLPTEENALSDRSRSMEMWIDARNDQETGEAQLCVHLQANGPTVIENIRDRWATVLIGGNLLSLNIQFDDIGHVAFDLPDTSDCRDALRGPVSIDVPGLKFSLRQESGRHAPD